MAESPFEVAAGAATLAVAGAFLVYAVQGADRGPSQGGTYPLTASFRSAQGVDLGTDVRLAGVRVGTVSGLALDPETYRAEMTLTIHGGIRLPEDSSVAVATEGLLGATFVEVVPGGSPFLLEPGMAIEDTQGALSLIGLLAQFVNAASGD